MPVPTQYLVHAATRDHNNPYNILTFPTHERYETNLCMTGHNFFSWGGKGIKEWKTEYAPIPNNYRILNKDLGNNQLPEYVNIDIVLSQNKFAQFNVAKQIASQLNCKLITLEHTLPPPTMPPEQIVNISNSMRGHLNVFISQYNTVSWGFKLIEDSSIHVIRHGIDTNLFTPKNYDNREPLVCSVVNDWQNRDLYCGFNLWRAITQYPKSPFQLNVWGDNPGISQPANGPEHLAREYQRSRIFLNTSLVSPVPTVLLEAMACGCAVVSTNNCMLPEILKHGENALVGNDPKTLHQHVQRLIDDPDLAMKLGLNARRTIINHFSLENFVENWNTVFRRAIDES